MILNLTWLVLAGVTLIVILGWLWRRTSRPQTEPLPKRKMTGQVIANQTSYLAGTATCLMILVSMASTLVDIQREITVVDVAALSIVGILTGVFLVLALRPSGHMEP